MNRMHPQDLRAIVAEVAERYPVAIFPAPTPGCSTDCYSAAGARLACRAILAELERTAKPEPAHNLEQLRRSILHTYPKKGEPMSIAFTHAQAEALLEFFGGDEETTITVKEVGPEGHSGPGLYAVCEGCEDEGSIFLPKGYDPIESTNTPEQLRRSIMCRIPAGELEDLKAERDALMAELDALKAEHKVCGNLVSEIQRQERERIIALLWENGLARTGGPGILRRFLEPKPTVKEQK